MREARDTGSSIQFAKLRPGRFRRASLILLFPLPLAQHRDRLKLLLLKASIDRGQFPVRQLAKVPDDVLQFMAEGLGSRDLVIGRPALVIVDVAVKRTEMFADAFFAGNRSAFFGRHDLGTEVIEVGGELLQPRPKRILL